MNSRLEIPLWAKVGELIWVELRNKEENEVLEYLEAIISLVDFDKKILKIKYKGSDAEKEVRADRILQREEEHKLVKDLADIPTLNDAELLKHMEMRYAKDLIHTYCGPTLIVVNPYKKTPNEESDELKENILTCLREFRLKDAPPHVWTISSYCFQLLFQMDKAQAVCISGESGAGKTESTKRCLAFITQMKSGRRSTLRVPIEDKIINCNPILEAFGNAKTFRNDNSSRFGKYTVLFLDKTNKKVRGASIENYLLEKSRVCVLGKEERNYHIFYAFCRFAPPQILTKYKLNNNGGSCDMKKFIYVNQSGVYEHPKINDKEFYNDVVNSFQSLDFSEGEQDAIWRQLAAILNLGNLKRDDSTYEEGKSSCKIIKDQTWKNVVELLEIDETLFEDALTHIQLQIGANVTLKPLSPNQTQNFIDSVAKEIYDRMFNWICKKLNQTLLPEDPNDPDYGTIGILDIFGFEIFEKNSIEQFMINYANERLQSLYIEYIFKNECLLFEQEGLGEYTSLIKYKDNKPIVLALDNEKIPIGIFQLIDQTCALNKKDENLHADIKRTHKTSQDIQFPRFSEQLSFIVIHTARDVEYLTDSFVEKNKDELSPYLQKAIDSSKKEIQDIFNQISGLKVKKEVVDKDERKNPKEKYLGFKFRRDMNNLIIQLTKCNCHFIRCIKPNEFKKNDFWNPQLALMQIRYMGLLDSLKVRKMSYPFRFTFKKFFEIYQDLDMGENGAKNFRTLSEEGADFKKLSKELIQFCDIPHSENDLLYGTTKIFLNETFKIQLDKALVAKQKTKKQALEILAKCYHRHIVSSKVKLYFETTSKSIMISRDLLKSWTAKLDGLKFKNYLKIVRKLQFKFRFRKYKRMKRFQAFNMQLITNYLTLYKTSKLVFYILHYKRKVQVMQSMLDKKIRDAKNRYCRKIVENLFNDTWNTINKAIADNSAKDLQRTFRSYLLRKGKKKEHDILKRKIEETIIFNSSSTLQRHIRGYLVRSRLDRLNRAASKIQGFFRMVWMRRYFVRLCKAVIVIQRFMKKQYLRHVQRNDGMDKFMKVYSTYNQSVALLEHKILFGDEDQMADLQNINDYTKLPFYVDKGGIDFGSSNYRNFIPKTPEIELNPKAKLVSILIDAEALVDTTNVYRNTWAAEFNSFLSNIHSKQSRLLHLEVGESFSVGVTCDKEVYTWGLNDFNQCAREDNNFSVGQSDVKNLSANPMKIITAGKDHAIMVDEGENIYVWGHNGEGQLGINNTRRTKNIHILNNISGKVRSAFARDNYSVLLMESGEIYEWPVYKNGNNILKPSLIELSTSIKIKEVELGTDFLIALNSNGLLYSKGENSYGELGLGDNENRYELTLVEKLKSLNEKVVEMSCGNKHVVCRTSLSKIYVWGLNSDYQLGQGDKENRNSPTRLLIPEYKKFRCKPRSVQAGYANSFFLLDDRNLFYCGRSGFNYQKNAQTPVRFNYEDKFFDIRMADNFTPIRIFTKWSKTMSIAYITFADFRNCKISSTIREKFIDKTNSMWQENQKFILPPQCDLLYKHINYKYLQKDKGGKPNISFAVDREDAQENLIRSELFNQNEVTKAFEIPQQKEIKQNSSTLRTKSIVKNVKAPQLNTNQTTDIELEFSKELSTPQIKKNTSRTPIKKELSKNLKKDLIKKNTQNVRDKSHQKQIPHKVEKEILKKIEKKEVEQKVEKKQIPNKIEKEILKKIEKKEVEKKIEKKQIPHKVEKEILKKIEKKEIPNGKKVEKTSNGKKNILKIDSNTMKAIEEIQKVKPAERTYEQKQLLKLFKNM
jgi:myosin-5